MCSENFKRAICIFFVLIVLITGIYSVSYGIGSGSVCFKTETNTGTLVSSHSQINTRQSLLVVDNNTGMKNAESVAINGNKCLQVRVPAKSFLFLFLFVSMAGSICLVIKRAELLKTGYTNSFEEIIHYLHNKDGLKG